MKKGKLATQIIVTPALPNFGVLSVFTVLFAKTRAVNTAIGTPFLNICRWSVGATVRAMAIISLAGTVHCVSDIWELKKGQLNSMERRVEILLNKIWLAPSVHSILRTFFFLTFTIHPFTPKQPSSLLLLSYEAGSGNKTRQTSWAKKIREIEWGNWTSQRL